jgi:hypothetical protein
MKSDYHICTIKEFKQPDVYYLQKRVIIFKFFPIELYYNQKGYNVGWADCFKTTNKSEIEEFKQFILDIKDEK